MEPSTTFTWHDDRGSIYSLTIDGISEGEWERAEQDARYINWATARPRIITRGVGMI